MDTLLTRLTGVALAAVVALGGCGPDRAYMRVGERLGSLRTVNVQVMMTTTPHVSVVTPRPGGGGIGGFLSSLGEVAAEATLESRVRRLVKMEALAQDLARKLREDLGPASGMTVLDAPGADATLVVGITQWGISASEPSLPVMAVAQGTAMLRDNADGQALWQQDVALAQELAVLVRAQAVSAVDRRDPVLSGINAAALLSMGDPEIVRAFQAPVPAVSGVVTGGLAAHRDAATRYFQDHRGR